MYKKRITVDPEIMLGKPIIAGTRITVESILKKLSDGYAVDEVVEIYPTLQKEDVLFVRYTKTEEKALTASLLRIIKNRSRMLLKTFTVITAKKRRTRPLP